MGDDHDDEPRSGAHGEAEPGGEDAKTLKREDAVEDAASEEVSPDGGSEPRLPGLSALLGANERGELHELGPGMIIDGKWELRARLGKGAFGEVYEAWHLKLDHPAAIKILVGQHEDAKQRFLEEAQLMAGMSSEHLVRASDYGELPDGSPYFVMDLVKGKSLRHWLNRERLPLERALEIGGEIVEGLVEAHKRGVVHGDIKPENVVIGEDDGKARVLDFGLAQTTATEGEDVGGTPHYMAPEMLFERAPATVRTDVYAVGVVLYEMLTGRLPRGHLDMQGFSKIKAAWESKPNPNPVLMHCNDVPQEQREALETLDRLVMEALAREPTARPKSAVPILEELRRLRKRLSPEALAPTLMGQTGPVRVASEVKTTAPFPAVEKGQRATAWQKMIGTVGVMAVAGLLVWRLWPPSNEVGRTAKQANVEKDSFGLNEIQAAQQGILVAVPENAGDAVMESHRVLRTELGCDRSRVEGVLSVLCRSVPAEVGAERLMDLAEQAKVRVVVFVGYGDVEEIEVRTTKHHQGNALVARLDGLELPKDPQAIAMVALVLRVLVGAHAAAGATGASEAGIPVLEWTQVGTRWGVLAEWLRVQQGYESLDDVERRKALARMLEGELAEERARGVDEGATFFRDLATLVLATSLSCAASEPMLSELSAGGEHASGIAAAACLELAGCMLEGGDAKPRVEEAAGELRKAFSMRQHDECVMVEAIGSVSWIDAFRGSDAGWEAHRKRLPGLQRCEPSAWSREYAVRGDALVHRGDWCGAAGAYGLAYEASNANVNALVAWPEYAWKCSEPTEESQRELQRALRAALGSGRFARPEQRVSIAYMRWWLTHDSADAQRVLEEHAKVSDGELPMIEGTASDLEQEICKGNKGDTCSLRILARPKRAGDAELLRSSLGLR